MAVIAVVNRKGGSGKSTLATHIAAYLAERGLEVMLGDVDRQQSSRLWLGLRPESRPFVHGWTIDDRNFARPPAGVKHVVLDTPGGFTGIGLMKVAMYADAILVPSTASLFDRRAASECLKELRGFPRVQLGKCRLASVGMRIDGRTRNAQLVDAWATGEGLDHLGTIKEAQVYARCLEQGLSLFDFPRNRAIDGYLVEWQRICEWVDETLVQAAAGAAPEGAGTAAPVTAQPRPSVLPAALAQRRAQAAAAAAGGGAAVP
ncbi:MAG: ParA family protein, partial [Burkholderiales bacterium]|nr:ParA family protein [Burkholderiales bacterium]